MTAQLDTMTVADIGGLDGKHHLWCQYCHPEWVMSLVGPGLGTPFTAWCGVEAVILSRWDSDKETPPGVCSACATPSVRCAKCGER